MKFDFDIMRAEAKIFAIENVESRVHLFSIIDPTCLPMDFGWVMKNQDHMITYGYAQYAARKDKEFEEAFNVFFMKYYDCELYHLEGETENWIDPEHDLNMTEEQVEVIRYIINTESRIAFEGLNHLIMDDELYEFCKEHCTLMDSNNRYKVIVSPYPFTFHFFVDTDLSIIPEDSNFRQELLWQKMEELKIEIPHHNYGDYIIEQIKRHEGSVTEYWEIGS